MNSSISVAVVCSSNQNRSMEAHNFLRSFLKFKCYIYITLFICYKN